MYDDKTNIFVTMFLLQLFIFFTFKTDIIRMFVKKYQLISSFMWFDEAPELRSEVVELLE